MKKTIILFISMFSFALYSQQSDFSAYFKTATKFDSSKLNQFVAEVYAENANAHKSTTHYHLMKELMTVRMAVVTLPNSDLSGVMSTNQVDLLNKHNKDLFWDSTYDAQTFNPFKYNLDFFSKEFKVYRIAETQSLLLIAPQ